ncbi:MAG: CheR family methyltransferase, partial [Pseudomonadota bacterium]
VTPSGRFATPSPSADRLFSALAAERGEQSLGIVLSGTGNDGSSGIQAIREAGGITIAQDVSSAKYDGMPSSAASTGCIDLVLTPQEIGKHLGKILAYPRDLETLKGIHAATSRMSDLMHILLARTRIDFRDYKESTVNRRVQRRMVALGITDYDDYVEHCRSNVAEVDALFKDLLISVTRFFRDPSSFNRLGDELQGVVEQVRDRPFRIWVAGCATGEEAYSVAILVVEAMGGPEILNQKALQVFATDIDGQALEIARKGVFPISAANDIPDDLVDKYFQRREDHIVAIPALKGTLLFSNHNVFQDPPFSNIDLVSLRNIMIYFNSRLQERVLHRVHYALNRHGILFLGGSEQLGASQPDFEVLSNEHKVFRKRIIGRTDARKKLTAFSSEPDIRRTGYSQKEQDSSQQYLFDALARAHGERSLLLDADMNILRVFGSFSDVVELSEETQLSLTLNLLLRPLREEAPTLCSLALRKGHRRMGLTHWIDNGNSGIAVTMEALPLNVKETSERYVLLTFDVDEKKPTNLEDLADAEDIDKQVLQQMQAEVSRLREVLQHTTEELQATNEELQSANEEMASTNEELQAANEELETSNEELQSTNEELITLNEELLVNSSELEELSREQNSMLRHAPSLIIVVDSALQIRRTSEEAKSRFKIPGQIENRVHLSQCFLPSGFPSLTDLASDAIRLRRMQEITFEIERVTISLRCAPFYGEDDTLQGAMIIVSEIDRTAEYFAQQELAQGMKLVEDSFGIAHWTLSADKNKMTWSDGMFSLHRLGRHETNPGLDTMLEMFLPEDRARLENAIDGCIERGRPLQFRGSVRRTDGVIAPIEVYGTSVTDSRGKTRHLVGINKDLTADFQHELLREQWETLGPDVPMGFYYYDAANDEGYVSDNLAAFFGFDADDRPKFDDLLQRIHPDDRADLARLNAATWSDGAYTYNARFVGQDGVEAPIIMSGTAFGGAPGLVQYVYGTVSFPAASV